MKSFRTIKSSKTNFYQGSFMSEKNKNEYRPINCSFYDLLLALATQRKSINLVYLQDKVPQNVSGSIIKDVYTKEGAEFMELSSGEVIRLDRIVKINDQLLSTDSSSSCKNLP